MFTYLDIVFDFVKLIFPPKINFTKSKVTSSKPMLLREEEFG
jgi:hypothetical protein